MSDNLDSRLAKIQRSLHINTLLNAEINSEYIQDYYEKSRVGYSLFHNQSGFVHMAISRDGTYKEDNLREHARFIQKYIDDIYAKNVLELATGRGANLLLLARDNPNRSFVGVDLTEAQLKYTSRKTLPKNISFEFGDFHNLNKQKSDSFDIVFVIEALCHSNKPSTVLREVHRVLSPGGYFIIFDGYLKKSREELSESEMLAKKITERGMAVGDFKEYASFLKESSNTGFSVDYEEDLSQFILPNLHRFERLARYYFKFPIISKILASILPRKLIYNSISGYLMPLLIEQGIASYNVTVLKKRHNDKEN